MSFSKCHDALRPVLPSFYMAFGAAASLFFAEPAAAQMRLDPSCVFREGSAESCTHVVACIGGDTLFVGGTRGWDRGTLSGELYTGARCTGRWDNASARAVFSCSDGTQGEVQYTRRDDSTGTAIGQGATLDGRPVEVWSGDNIGAYIQRETGRVTLQCGVQEIPMM